MNLSSLFPNIKTVGEKKPILFKGTPVETPFTTRDGEIYYMWELVEPLDIYCSTNQQIFAGTKELMIRSSILNLDTWEQEGENFKLPGYITDYSVSKGFAILTDKTIRDWVQEERNSKRAEYQNSSRSQYQEVIKRLRDNAAKV